jgi:hypothetical protein
LELRGGTLADTLAGMCIDMHADTHAHCLSLDVAKLVDDSSTLSDDAIKNIMRDYNIEQYQPALTPDGHRLVVSVHGQVGEDEYLDPKTGKVLTFDHRNHKFTGETGKKQELNGDINAVRTAIETALESYSEAQYKQDKCTITVYGADDGTITVCLSARNTHLAAYWYTYTLCSAPSFSSRGGAGAGLWRGWGWMVGARA